MRQCRSVLAVHTKTLGASQIAGCKEMLEHKSDETSQRGVTFGDSIVRIADVNGYKNVALSSAIIVKDGTTKEQVSAIKRTFSEGRELLLHTSCDTAQKVKLLLQEEIETSATEAGIPEDQICIYQAD